MAGKIVVSEILSDATSSNTVKIGTGMTLDLNAQGTTVLPTIPDSKLPTIPVSKMPAGSAVQITRTTYANKTAVSAAETKLMEGTITTKLANSKILVTLSISVGGPNTYEDDDLAFAIGWKSGSTSSSAGDYTPIHGNPYSRESVNVLGSFFACDTMRGGSYMGGTIGEQYWSEEKTYQNIASPQQPAGTIIYVPLFCSYSNGGGGSWSYVNIGGNNSTGTNAGHERWMTLMEIAG
jgi:hypothetical protein